MPLINQNHETHTICDKRSNKGIGDSKCCYCNPHAQCELANEQIAYQEDSFSGQVTMAKCNRCQMISNVESFGSHQCADLKEDLIIETTERIVIDYANLSGREYINRAEFRIRTEKHIRKLLSKLK